jgi:hypothetical protein
VNTRENESKHMCACVTSKMCLRESETIVEHV